MSNGVYSRSSGWFSISESTNVFQQSREAKPSDYLNSARKPAWQNSACICDLKKHQNWKQKGLPQLDREQAQRTYYLILGTQEAEAGRS